MYGNPADEWKALAENYRSMSDGELCELGQTFGDLTPTAQQVLRDEMRLRKLGDPQAPGWRQSAPASDAADQSSHVGDVGEVEYTWKTPLCQADSDEHAWQLQEVLRRAKIDSWIEGPNSYARTSGSIHTSFSMGLGPIVVVAADQLEEARRIIEQPIPADVIEASRDDGSDEYELPLCPKCGAAEPVLESADPVNEWKCESCGAEWSEEPSQDVGAS